VTPLDNLLNLTFEFTSLYQCEKSIIMRQAVNKNSR
jgi:hypothetical protein